MRELTHGQAGVLDRREELNVAYMRAVIKMHEAWTEFRALRQGDYVGGRDGGPEAYLADARRELSIHLPTLGINQ
jgi:hypothetical protein